MRHHDVQDREGVLTSSGRFVGSASWTGGPSGFVVGVNWRSTKIGDRFNNLIMIPNSTMMDSIMTNYYAESNRTI